MKQTFLKNLFNLLFSKSVIASVCLGLIYGGYTFYTQSLPPYEDIGEVTSALKIFLGEYLDINYALSEARKELDPQDSIIQDILDEESKIDEKRELLVEEKKSRLQHNKAIDDAKSWAGILSCTAVVIVGIGCIVSSFWK